jgi:signal transduction histidine kinase
VQKKELDTLTLMASYFAHEVKNPLGSMKLFAALLRDELNALGTLIKPEIKSHITNVLVGIDTIDKIVNKVLSVDSRDSSEWSIVNLSALLLELTHFIAPRFPKVSFKADGALTPLANPYIKGNELTLRQVFSNLLINAFEAARSEVEINLADSLEKECVEIYIRDDGEGVAEGLEEEIFTPFFSSKERGSGLGLAVVKSAVNAHLGDVRYRREEQGGYFVVSLPQKNV